MAIHLKTVILTYLLTLMVLMEEVKPVLAKKGKGLKQRTQALENIVSELQKGMKELKECKVCSKIKDLNEMLSELQDKIDSKDTWHKMNTEPVCFGTRDNQYGALRIPKSGRLKTIKLIYKSGGVQCNEDDATYWGCDYKDYGDNGLLTVITTANNETVMPPVEDLKSSTVCNRDFWSLNGTTRTSPELVFPDLSVPLSVSRNQELKIWYTQDMYDCSEDNNSGSKTCVDAYAWYA